jgi:hypothetical protein
MITYTVGEAALSLSCSITAIATLEVAAEVLLLVSPAGGFQKPPRAEKPAPRSAIANPTSDLKEPLSGSGSNLAMANAWGFA